MNEALAERVRQARFATTLLRGGYDMGQVDDFLDQVVAALTAGQPVGELVDGSRFRPVRLRAGYDMGEVDTFLDTVRREAVAS